MFLNEDGNPKTLFGCFIIAGVMIGILAAMYFGIEAIGYILKLLPWYVWLALAILGLYLLHESANRREIG